MKASGRNRHYQLSWSCMNTWPRTEISIPGKLSPADWERPIRTLCARESTLVCSKKYICWKYGVRLPRTTRRGRVSWRMPGITLSVICTCITTHYWCKTAFCGSVVYVPGGAVVDTKDGKWPVHTGTSPRSRSRFTRTQILILIAACCSSLFINIATASIPLILPPTVWPHNKIRTLILCYDL